MRSRFSGSYISSRSSYGIFLVAASVSFLLAQPSLAQEWLSEGEEGFLPGKLDGLEITNDGDLRLTSFEGVNFALGIDTYSNGTALGAALTDGNLATEWDFDEDPKVVGKTIDIDLGGNRLVNQVRILPGSGAGADNPEYFVKGYRVEMAPEEAPDAFGVVADNHVNRVPLVDTSADGTWLRYEDGAPVATLGRYLRVTITRQDLPNWVIIGEVEVFGTGFHARGQYLSALHDFGERVNVGAGFFQAETPPGTRMHLQFRAGVDQDYLPRWDDFPFYGVDEGKRGVFFPVRDPSRYIQYRALLETENPFISPELSEVRVQFDPRLVARSATGRIDPREVPVGEPVSLTYTAEIYLGSENYPLDLLILDRPGKLEEISMRLAVVPPEKYRTLTPHGSLQEDNLIIQLDPDLIRSSVRQLEIVFTTVFFMGTEEVNLFLGSSLEGSDPENLQKVAPRIKDGTLVTVLGAVDELVPSASVAIRPRVFRPDRGGATRIEFDLTKVLVPVPVTVTIHELSGRRVSTVVDREMLAAGEISISWDGFDDHRGVLAPGIYMCRIRVHAQESATLVRFLGIAY